MISKFVVLIMVMAANFAMAAEEESIWTLDHFMNLLGAGNN